MTRTIHLLKVSAFMYTVILLFCLNHSLSAQEAKKIRFPERVFGLTTGFSHHQSQKISGFNLGLHHQISIGKKNNVPQRSFVHHSFREWDYSQCIFTQFCHPNGHQSLVQECSLEISNSWHSNICRNFDQDVERKNQCRNCRPAQTPDYFKTGSICFQCGRCQYHIRPSLFNELCDQLHSTPYLGSWSHPIRRRPLVQNENIGNQSQPFHSMG